MDINRKAYPDIYKNVEACVEFCKSIQPIKLTETVPYHMLWLDGYRGGSFRKLHQIVVKSYVLTQQLDKTVLNIWTNSDLKQNDYFKPLKDFVTIKLYNDVEETKGTILQNYFYLGRNDSKCYGKSDIFRLLILYKYGGFYTDFDTIYLRDLSPLLNQEFISDWAGSPTRLGGNALRFFKESKVASKCLRQLLSTPPKEEISWGGYLFDKANISNDLTVLPCAFFDPEWCLTGDWVERMKKHQFSNRMFEGTFLWHFHNGYDLMPEDGSKFDILSKQIDKEFYEKYGL